MSLNASIDAAQQLLEFDATDTAWMIIGAFVFTIGLILNGSIIAILVRVDRTSPSMSHRLLISLALADGLLMISQAIGMFAHLALGHQNMSLCRFAGVFFPITGCQALLSLGIIAVDRFFAVVRMHRLAYFPLYVMLAVTWTYSLLIGITPLFGFNTVVYQPSKIFCLADWSDPAALALGYTILCMLTLWLTVIATVACYAVIWRNVRAITRRAAPLLSGQQQSALVHREEAAAAKRMFLLLVFFLVAWSPYGVSFCYQVATHRKPTYSEDMFCTFCVFTESAINPVLYVLLDRKYQTALKSTALGTWFSRTFKCSRASSDRERAVEQREPTYTHTPQQALTRVSQGVTQPSTPGFSPESQPAVSLFRSAKNANNNSGGGVAVNSLKSARGTDAKAMPIVTLHVAPATLAANSPAIADAAG